MLGGTFFAILRFENVRMVFPDFFFHFAFFFVSPFRIEDLRVGVRTGDGGGHNERYKGKGVAYIQGARSI